MMRDFIKLLINNILTIFLTRYVKYNIDSRFVNYLGNPINLTILVIDFERAALFLSLHSQTMITFHPIFFRDRFTILSLDTLAPIFCFQNSMLDVGNVDFLQFLCPCQKHP